MDTKARTNPPANFSRTSWHPQKLLPKEVRFYDKHRPHYGFTNFSSHVIRYEGRTYPTSEHLFQALKFLTHRPLLAEHIRTCSRRPSMALGEARRFKPEVRRDWNNKKIGIMEEVLRLKFEQHPYLRRELERTEDALLVEMSRSDGFWGCGSNGKGRNELGKALMRLRRDLKRKVVENTETQTMSGP